MKRAPVIMSLSFFPGEHGEHRESESKQKQKERGGNEESTAPVSLSNRPLSLSNAIRDFGHEPVRGGARIGHGAFSRSIDASGPRAFRDRLAQIGASPHRRRCCVMADRGGTCPAGRGCRILRARSAFVRARSSPRTSPSRPRPQPRARAAVVAADRPPASRERPSRALAPALAGNGKKRGGGALAGDIVPRI